MADVTEDELKKMISTPEGLRALAQGIRDVLHTDLASDDKITALVATPRGVERLKQALDQAAGPIEQAKSEIEHKITRSIYRGL
jgi:hypothetical protein